MESDLNILRNTNLISNRENLPNLNTHSKSKKEINVYRDYSLSPENDNYIKNNDQNWLQTNHNPLAFSTDDQARLNPVASHNTLRQEFNSLNKDQYQSSND